MRHQHVQYIRVHLGLCETSPKKLSIQGLALTIAAPRVCERAQSYWALGRGRALKQRLYGLGVSSSPRCACATCCIFET